jgi:hypothetical protein
MPRKGGYDVNVAAEMRHLGKTIWHLILEYFWQLQVELLPPF